MFRDKSVETMDRSSIEKIQLQRLKATFTTALRTKFYADRFRKAAVRSVEDIRCLKDLEKIPFTTKDDLRASYPEGLLAVDRSKVVRLHTSSGTTGMPTVIYHTKEDIDSWAELVTRSIVACGVTKKDIFQNSVKVRKAVG